MGDFKHIRVTAAEEDDEVIVAGAPAGAQAAGEPAGAACETVDEPVDAAADGEAAGGAAAAAEIVATVADAADDERVRGSADEPAGVGPGVRAQPVSGSVPDVRPQAGKADSYSATTLEDLDSAPMPFAQKAVIVAAIICIIGAVIYYFAAMR